MQPSVVSITTGSGEGSGVVLTADGYVLTNNHVVASASGDTVNVVFDNGKSARATIVGTDPKTDLAVVKADGVSGLTPATFGDSGAVQVGDTVLALGSPLGLQGSVTAGIISAKDRTIRTGGDQQDSPFPSQQQQQSRDVAVRPAADRRADQPGQLRRRAGQHQRRGDRHQHRDRHLRPGQRQHRRRLRDPEQQGQGRRRRAAQRREGQPPGRSACRVTENESGAGALVSAVTANSPAAKAGLQQGDIVTKFDGQAINDSDDLVAAVQSHKVGDQVRADVHPKRRGKDGNRDARRSVLVTAPTTSTPGLAGRRDSAAARKLLLPIVAGDTDLGGWSCRPPPSSAFRRVVTCRPAKPCVAVR